MSSFAPLAISIYQTFLLNFGAHHLLFGPFHSCHDFDVILVLHTIRM